MSTLQGVARLVAAGWCLLLTTGVGASGIERQRTNVVVSDATNMSVAVSADGRRIAFDLQGALWVMPTRGGKARRITEIDLESRLPQWSPEGGQIVFQCYSESQWQLCTVGPDGQSLRKLTSASADHREPSWSPDGRRIVFAADLEGGYDLWELVLGTGQTRRLLVTPEDESYPVWSPRGDRLTFVAQGRDDARLLVRSSDGQQRALVTVSGRKQLHLPAWHPDGDSISYLLVDIALLTSELHVVNVQTGVSRRLTAEREDVSASRANWLDANTIVYAADGGIRKLTASGRSSRIDFSAEFAVERHRYTHRDISSEDQAARPVLGLLRPQVAPDGRQVVFAALSDLWVLRIGQSQPTRLTHDAPVDADPVYSPDGKQIAFTSDRRESGTMDLWLYDLRTDQRRMLASVGESISLPSFSRDGRHIAFLAANSADWHDRVVHVVDLVSGELRKMPTPLFHPSRPSWSPDGRTLVLSSIEPRSSRSRKAWNRLFYIDVADFKGRFVDTQLGRSLGPRSANGPEWSPDGSRIAFVADGALWSQNVSATGQPVGAPVRLSNVLADSISWTADSRHIVFLSNGQLQRLLVPEGALTRIPMTLDWRRQEPGGRTVIRAGRLFDGLSAKYVHNVDVVIEGRRIAAVQPWRDDWEQGVRVIDASSYTVMPGLIESHIHNFPMNGDATGRLFLSFGVTSIREVGADPYEGLEARESWASGARPGPRSFYSGLLEGGQVYYPMSLAIRSDAHFNQELGRITALDYDLVKTYESLADHHFARVVSYAHERGLTVTSHELWPAAAWGADAVEHLSTRDRSVFSDRLSLGGEVYGDVIQLLRESGMAITSTGFAFSAGLERPAGAARWKPSDLPQIRDLLPERYRLMLDESQAKATDPFASPRAAAAAKTIVKMHSAGIPVIPATDSSFHLAGLSLVREMLAFHKAGLPMHAVLTAATRDAAKVLGAADDLGTIEPGKLADLVLIDGDPLRTPTDLLNVSMVVKSGITFTQSNLVRAAPADNEDRQPRAHRMSTGG